MKKVLLTIVLILMLSTVQVMAQEVLTYGSTALSTLSAAAPISIYTFQGTEGDQVTIQAISISPGLELSTTLQSGTEILATSDSDPFSADSSDARMDLLLPATNLYVVLVTSTSGQTGDFLLKLNGQAAADKTVVTGLPADVEIIAGETSYYSFDGSPDGLTVLGLDTLSPELVFRAVVRDENGQIVSTSSGTSLIVTVPGAGPYEIALSGVTAEMAGFVTVTEGADGFEPAPEAPGDDGVPAPATTEEPGDAAPTTAPDTPNPTEEPPAPISTEEVSSPDGACTAISSGVVNIRTAPSTNNAVVAQMQPGQTYPVVGVYQDWYQITYNNGAGSGWVFAGVIATGGDCGSLPVVAPSTDGTAPTAPPPVTPTSTSTTTSSTTVTATMVPTTSTNDNTQPTATYTPSYTPTSGATATYTPSYTPTTAPAQEAPPDARFNSPLNIQLDSTASVLDFVSYPGGDTEDRVRWDIIGMNNNVAITGGQARLVISVSCFGTGIDQVQFFTGGQTYGCGATIYDQEVTANSRTGSVTITAVGGSDTYVQWVLTGTATRTN